MMRVNLHSPGYFKTLIYSLAVIILASAGIYAQKYDSLALTPPMGWNNWNKFGPSINEKLVREIADAMVSSGMKDLNILRTTA